ncbi:MAG TPA: hypothetical protein VNY27_05015 [Solirubrobacteraceae bacterium]|nr:hypothetical protein [Solirubrobacteraceae bacterium]
MNDILRTVPAIEGAAVLTLKASRDVSRRTLEETALDIEQILGEHVADIAPGASACANFENDSIEIDVSLTGDSPTELHQRLAAIIGVIERQRALNVHGNGQDELVLTSSATQMAHAA